MLNTKLLLLIVGLLASVAGYAAYQHQQELARRQENQRFWNQVERARQNEAVPTASSPKANDVRRYRIP